jgi:hypothetical protein
MKLLDSTLCQTREFYHKMNNYPSTWIALEFHVGILAALGIVISASDLSSPHLFVTIFVLVSMMSVMVHCFDTSCAFDRRIVECNLHALY